jgi:RND family efflux transporter MFP subunit
MKRLLWPCLILLVLALAYAGLRRALIPESAGAIVTRGQAIYAVTGSVSVSAEAESQIVSPVEGVLKESSLTEGQSVQAGDVLAKLDPGEIPFLKTAATANLADIEARLAGRLPSEIQLESMLKDFDNDQALFKGGFIGPADFENRQRAVEQQKTLAQEDRSGLETQRDVLKNNLADYDDQIRRLDIAAPYDGAITAVLAHPGDWLAKGAPVASIISRAFKIESEVNQDDIAAVSENETAQVRFFAYPSQIFQARVKFVLPTSDKVTQRFTVLLELLDSPPGLVAGLTGEVSYIAGEHDGVLLIPRRALFGDNVAVVKNGRVEIRAVQPGFVTLTQAEIVSGLSEGETVLTENPGQFRTGDHVRLTAAAPSGGN